MKILHINTSDTIGGAAIAAMRLHKAMLAAGMDSTFFCLNRSVNDDERILTIGKKAKLKSRTIDVIKRILFSQLFLSGKKGLFSNMKYGYKIDKYINLNDFDIIYIHWINNSFLSLKGLEQICKTGKKIFWFMHDMFPITGGCHHSFECNRYIEGCGLCSYLKNPYKKDFSYRQIHLKNKILSKYTNISFIAPSKWLYDCTISSLIAKNHNVYHIPNLLDEDIFRPLNKQFSREVLNLPNNKKILLFGADSALTNPYKGFNYLINALELLARDEDIKTEELFLVIFGSSYNKLIASKLPFNSHFMGIVHDSFTLSLLYNSADVFCISSIAENFPNTILESINCGTPVVGFNIGGIPDLVDQKTGYLAKYKNSDDFAKGIKVVLGNKNNKNFQINKNLSKDYIINTHIQLY